MIGSLDKLVVSVATAATDDDAADLVLRNGKIVTVDADNPEVQALAARDGLIIALGSNQDISSYISATTNVIDLDSALAIPGFIEGHAHFMGIGNAVPEEEILQAKVLYTIVGGDVKYEGHR